MILLSLSSLRKKADKLLDGEKYLEEVLSASENKQGATIFIEEGHFELIREKWEDAELREEEKPVEPRLSWDSYVAAVRAHGTTQHNKDLDVVVERLKKLPGCCGRPALQQRFMGLHPAPKTKEEQ